MINVHAFEYLLVIQFFTKNEYLKVTTYLNKYKQLLKEIFFSQTFAIVSLIVYSQDYIWPSFFFICLSYLFHLQNADGRNIAHLLWASGIGIFIIGPASLDIVITGNFSAKLLYSAITLSSMFYYFCDINRFQFVGLYNSWRARKVYFGFFVFFSAILALSNGFSYDFTMLPLFAICIMTLKGELKQDIFQFSIFLLFIAQYGILYWEGFGRIIIGIPIVMSFLVFMLVRGIEVNRVIFCSVLTVVAAFSSYLRHGFSHTLVLAVLNDSIFLPYKIGADLVENGSTVNIAGFFDQILLYFTIIIPRALWESKPIGFGRLYVEVAMDPNVVADYHSIASTFIGEHVHYLDSYFFLSALFAIWLVATTINLFGRIPFFKGIFYIFPMSWIYLFVWGGLATYASRVQMSLVFLPLILYIFWLCIGQPKSPKNVKSKTRRRISKSSNPRVRRR